MKKTIAVLLLAVAGVGIYYALQKKKSVSNSFDQQLIVGTWKLDSLMIPDTAKENDIFTGIMGMIDTDLLNYHYSFKKDKTVTLALGDSIAKDSSSYEWLSKDTLLWRDSPTDKAGTKFKLENLTKDSLLLRENDSTRFIFLRIDNGR